MRALVSSCALVLCGCGARTELESASTADAAPVVDAASPADADAAPIACAAWSVAGPDVLLSAPDPTGMKSVLTSVIPSNGGALVAWFVTPSPMGAWTTRSVNFDGTPRVDAATHMGFATTVSPEPWAIQLASSAGVFAAALDTEAGCAFVQLDADGNPHGSVNNYGLGGAAISCLALGPSNAGFSFVATATPPALYTLTPQGYPNGLDQPLESAGALSTFGRLVFQDESFLLSTYVTTAGGTLESQLQHFSREGSALAGASTLTTSVSEPAALVETPSGALAAWVAPAPASPVLVMPVSHDGVPLGAAPRVATSAGPFVAGSVLASTPQGDVLLAWYELELDSGESYPLYVSALHEDGSALGAPTHLPSHITLSGIKLLVDPTGTRALLFYTGSPNAGMEGVHALPLACSP